MADTDVDIFQTIKETNESLVEVLAKQVEQTQQEAPVYVQPPPPAPTSPNYLLYIGIGIAILFLIGKVKI